ncbi:UNVERIFIED_CONTAM: putative carbohydrate-binding protein with starch-binding CBM53 [Acetivibrio alkalicellulosi]
MRFFDFLFNNDDKKDTTDNNQIEPIDIVPTNLIGVNEEFSDSLATDMQDAQAFNDNYSYSNNGVEFSNAQDTFRLLYNGVLSQNGANEIYAVVGYGNNLDWEDVREYPMFKREDNKYELLLTIKRSGNINIAFKDELDNWDNNLGHNYSFINYVH